MLEAVECRWTLRAMMHIVVLRRTTTSSVKYLQLARLNGTIQSERTLLASW